MNSLTFLFQLKKMDMKDYIIELSKTYSIVTQLTSFIAVEKREKVRNDKLMQEEFEDTKRGNQNP